MDKLAEQFYKDVAVKVNEKLAALTVGDLFLPSAGLIGGGFLGGLKGLYDTWSGVENPTADDYSKGVRKGMLSGGLTGAGAGVGLSYLGRAIGRPDDFKHSSTILGNAGMLIPAGLIGGGLKGIADTFNSSDENNPASLSDYISGTSEGALKGVGAATLSSIPILMAIYGMKKPGV